MLFCRAAVDVSRSTLNYVAGLIGRHRKAIGSIWRRLNPGQQALLVLVYLRKGETFSELAAGFGVSTATAWRYVEETVRLLSARSPKLRQAVRKAKKDGLHYLVPDGTLTRTDRVKEEKVHCVGGRCEHDGMIATPDDYSRFPSEHLPDLGGAYCFTYVRGLTPEELVTRLGVRVEDCSRMTLDELTSTAYSGYDGKSMFFGVTAVGDWVLIVEANGRLGVTDEIIVPLSAGTRLVSHFYLDIKCMDYFHWIEDGKIRFEFQHQDGYSHWIKDGKVQREFPHWEGYSEEMPDELAETMERIDSVYPPHTDPNEGPAFLLAERLTGITMTPQLLEEATYLCGAVPDPR